jgi:hypothetical protein
MFAPYAAIPLHTLDTSIPAGGTQRRRCVPWLHRGAAGTHALTRLVPAVPRWTWDSSPVSTSLLPLAGRRPPPGHQCHRRFGVTIGVLLRGASMDFGGGTDGRGASVGPYALMAWISAVQTELFGLGSPSGVLDGRGLRVPPAMQDAGVGNDGDTTRVRRRDYLPYSCPY